VNRSQLRWRLVIIAVLLWFAAVVPPYYAVHKPLAGTGIPSPLPVTFNPPNLALGILSLFANLGLLFMTLAAAAAWGSRIARGLGVTFDSGLEQWALAVTLGLGLLGTLVLAIGAVGGLYPWVGYLILLALSVGALSELRKLLHWFVDGLRQFEPTGIPWAGVYAGLIGLISLGLALLPPTAWDALVYHLQGSRLYLEAHRLVAVPDNLYLNWPSQTEMLFTWGMLLKGDILSKLFHWVFWPLTAILVYAFGRRTIGAPAARWATVLWAAVPFAGELAGQAYVDLALTGYILASIYAFQRWTDNQSDQWLILSAIFVGLGIATKYTAATWLGLLVLLVVYYAWKRQRRPVIWIGTRVAACVLAAGVPIAPWLAKNWIFTGNPVYPFLFGGLGWNPTRQALIVGTGGSYSHNLLDYLAMPWVATVIGSSGTAAFDATIGPLLLFLAPLVLLVRKRPPAINYALILVAGQGLYFLVTIYQYVYLVETRLILPVFPLLCLIAGFALSHLPAWDLKSFRLSWVVSSMISLVLVLNVLTEAKALLEIHPFAPLLGLESRQAYLARRLGAYFQAMQDTNGNLPPDAKIFYLWEPRGYYSQHTSRADATLDNLAQLELISPNADAALAALKADGFGYLLYYRAGLQFLLGPTPRPPTLVSLIERSQPQESNYPLAEDDLDFLTAILARCRKLAGTSEVYEIYQLP
jgi:hypothetical protein